MLQLSTPILGSFAALSSVYLVDSFWVAYLGDAPLAAVGLVVPLFGIVTGIQNALGTGVRTALARALGAGDRDTVVQLSAFAFALVVASGVGTALVAFAAQQPVLRMYKVSDPQLVGMAISYLTPLLAGLPFLALQNVCANALNGHMQTRAAMRINWVFAGVHFALDPILIFGFGPVPALGLAGAGIATALAWGIAGLVGLRMLRSQGLLAKADWGGGRALTVWRSILSVGLPAMVNEFIMPLSLYAFVAYCSDYGNAAIATAGLGLRIGAVLFSIPGAAGIAAQILISIHHAGGNLEEADALVRLTHRFAMVWGSICWIVLGGAGHFLAPALLDDRGVGEALAIYLAIVPATYGLRAVTMMSAGALNAIDRGLWSTGLTVMSAVLVVLFCAVGSSAAGLLGVFTGVTLVPIVTAIVAWLSLIHHRILIWPKVATVVEIPEPHR